MTLSHPNRFEYQKPSPEQTARIETVRAACKTLLNKIDGLCPASRQRSVAITELETSAMWAEGDSLRGGAMTFREILFLAVLLVAALVAAFCERSGCLRRKPCCRAGHTCGS